MDMLLFSCNYKFEYLKDVWLIIFVLFVMWYFGLKIEVDVNFV